MPGWNNVEKLVESAGEHSTLIGKFWITSFFVIRYLLVIVIAKASWEDDQGNFVCNTESPGCKNVCFNEFSPIVPVRFWFFQLLAVSVMSIVFSVYTTHKLALVSKAICKKHLRKTKKISVNQVPKLKADGTKVNKENEADKAKGVEKIEEPQEEVNDDKVVATKLQSHNPPKLFLAYFCMVFLRLAVEIGFMIGQYHLYTYQFVVPELWECHHWPCPNVVDCFVSRPKEKTIMICSFYATGCIIIILNVLELYSIRKKLGDAWQNRSQDITKEVFGDDEGLMFNGAGGIRPWVPGVDRMYEVLPRGYPDAVGIPMLYTKQRRHHPRKSDLPGNRMQDEFVYS